MNNKQLIAISILVSKEGRELPNFSVLEHEASILIVELIRSYDYSLSNEFLVRTESKSKLFKAKLLSATRKPTAAKKLKIAFINSVREIETSDKILEFLPSDQGLKVARLRSLLAKNKELLPIYGSC